MFVTAAVGATASDVLGPGSDCKFVLLKVNFLSKSKTEEGGDPNNEQRWKRELCVRKQAVNKLRICPSSLATRYVLTRSDDIKGAPSSILLARISKVNVGQPK